MLSAYSSPLQVRATATSIVVGSGATGAWGVTVDFAAATTGTEVEVAAVAEAFGL